MKEKNTETVGLMMRVVRMHRRACERSFEKFGLHHSQHRMLIFLYRSGRPLAQKELAEHFGISAAAASVTVKKLEGSGHIRITPCQKDRRQYSIDITEKGRDVAERSKLIFSDVDSAMLTGLDESQKESLRAAFEIMKENLEREMQ